MELFTKGYLRLSLLWLPCILVVISPTTAQFTVTKVLPSRNVLAPISLGVDIIVIGGNFPANLSVILTKDGTEVADVAVTSGNSSHLHLETNNETLNTNVQVGMTTQMLFKTEAGNILEPQINVTFVKDPFIENVRPLVTITRGGIGQTVKGRNFHNQYLFMTIQVKCAGVTHVVDNIQCSEPVDNGTSFVCPTPNIDSNEYRHIPSSCHYSHSTSEFEVILFHGEPVRGPIAVYKNPEVLSVGTTIFKPYKGETQLSVGGTGNRFHTSIPPQYYTVTIGSVSCNITIIYSNKIYCTPPSSPPPPGPYDKDGEFRLVVSLGNFSAVAGYVKYELNAWEDPGVIYGTIGGICGAVVLVVLITLIVFLVRRAQKKRHEYIQSIREARLLLMEMRTEREMKHRDRYRQRPAAQATNQDLFSLLNPQLQGLIKSHLYHAPRLAGQGIEENKVGEGQFGEVYRGTFRKSNGELMEVAIKACKGNADHATKVDFLQEAVLMKPFDHPYVIKLVAIVIDISKPYVVLPFMKNGDLKHYIKDKNNVLRVRDLMTFALHVAKGMVYLSNKKFVHRDLAARNCMVDEDLSVKVADFGLARDVFEKEYYHIKDRTRPLPVKWMAIETLEGSPFTSASDVWSFGVLLWELITRGRRPFNDLQGPEVKTALQRGRRLPKPAHAPNEVYELMLLCWLPVPRDRATFSELVFMLDGLLAEEEGVVAMATKIRTRKLSVGSNQTDTDYTGGTQRSDYSDYLQILHSSPPTPWGDDS